MTIPLSQVLELRKEVARLTDEVALLRIALADAATVPTGDLERGIRALTEERDALTAEVERLREEINTQIERAVAADFETLSTLVTDKNERMAQLQQKLDAERTRYVLADAGWKEMDRQRLAAEADVKALAEALAGLQSYSNNGGCWCDTRDFGLEDHTPLCLAALAALARDGVRRGKGK